MGETIIVTELAWLENQPRYGKSKDPATFGHAKELLRAQAVALNSTTEMDPVKLPIGELQLALSAGFSVKSEPCIVIEAKDHLTYYGKGEK